MRRLAAARQQAADALRFERAQHVNALLMEIEESTLGRPLALLPVAARNWAVIVERPSTGRSGIFFICRGLFAGRVSLEGQRCKAHTLSMRLHSGAWRRDDRPREGAMAVDELRIVSAWLQRMRPYAHWIPCDVEHDLTEVTAMIERALATRA